MNPLVPKISLWSDRLLDLIYPRNCVVTGYPVSEGAYRYLSDESLLNFIAWNLPTVRIVTNRFTEE